MDLLAWAAWVVLFAPLLVAVLVACVPAIRASRRRAAGLAIGSVGFGLLMLLVYLVAALQEPGAVHACIVPWLTVGDTVQIAFGTRMDALAITMGLVVTGVALVVLVYARAAMKDDPSSGRFFGSCALLVSAMLGIVFSPNFLQTFLFWQLLGLGAYLLIGHAWTRDEAGRAARKAFMTQRVGDCGFLIGMLMVWAAVGALRGVVDTGMYSAFDFQILALAVDQVGFEGLFQGGSMAAALVAALVFCGAMAKSAQLPLHGWLPDSVHGPSPAVALMHAVTLGAAGIYMIARCSALFAYAAWAPTLLCWIGALTALVAAGMAITQYDIRKVLAYASLAQLGVMVMALGAGAYTTAVVHLTAYAVGMALLFLCADVVVRGCGGAHDMRTMGGLRTAMPATFKTWVVGTVSLTALLPIAGWGTKVEILAALLATDMVAGSGLLFVVGLLVAALAAFALGRATLLVFGGTYRGSTLVTTPPQALTMPLWSLATGAVVLGVFAMPDGALPFAEGSNLIERFLAGEPAASPLFHWGVAMASMLMAAMGFFAARSVYSTSAGADPLPERLGPTWTLFSQRLYIDHGYRWFVDVVQQGLARGALYIERWILIQGVVNTLAQSVRVVGDRVRRVQAGRLGDHVISLVLGAVILGILVLLQVGMARAAGGS